ncbi:hypothetical protein WJX72_007554 [[Myrmecia] bisecta]|uniref:Uncharacterized protein n=1 Tax=[Myrmecia] bisecta TaxID=41462 RepID=A0AAW1PT56_9CHLO
MGRAIEARGPGMQQDLPITGRQRVWLPDNKPLNFPKKRKAGSALPNLEGLQATASSPKSCLPPCKSWTSAGAAA